MLDLNQHCEVVDFEGHHIEGALLYLWPHALREWSRDNYFDDFLSELTMYRGDLINIAIFIESKKTLVDEVGPTLAEAPCMLGDVRF